MSTEEAIDTIVTLRPEPNGPDVPTLEITPSKTEEEAVSPPIWERLVPVRRQRPWPLPWRLGRPA
jgi:hypothetical protein